MVAAASLHHLLVAFAAIATVQEAAAQAPTTAAESQLQESRDKIGAARAVADLWAFNQYLKQQVNSGGAEAIAAALDAHAFRQSQLDGTGVEGEMQALQTGLDDWEAAEEQKRSEMIWQAKYLLTKSLKDASRTAHLERLSGTVPESQYEGEYDDAEETTEHAFGRFEGAEDQTNDLVATLQRHVKESVYGSLDALRPLAAEVAVEQARQTAVKQNVTFNQATAHAIARESSKAQRAAYKMAALMNSQNHSGKGFHEKTRSRGGDYSQHEKETQQKVDKEVADIARTHPGMAAEVAAKAAAIAAEKAGEKGTSAENAVVTTTPKPTPSAEEQAKLEKWKRATADKEAALKRATADKEASRSAAWMAQQATAADEAKLKKVEAALKRATADGEASRSAASTAQQTTAADEAKLEKVKAALKRATADGEASRSAASTAQQATAADEAKLQRTKAALRQAHVDKEAAEALAASTAKRAADEEAKLQRTSAALQKTKNEASKASKEAFVTGEKEASKGSVVVDLKKAKKSLRAQSREEHAMKLILLASVVLALLAAVMLYGLVFRLRKQNALHLSTIVSLNMDRVVCMEKLKALSTPMLKESAQSSVPTNVPQAQAATMVASTGGMETPRSETD